MATPLPVVNLREARFECIYGRGCDGICCQNGRPPVYPEEAAVIDEHLDRFLPHLRPEARALIEREGYLSRRVKAGQPMLRVIGGWCVFFKQGCVLHKVGAEDGDSYQYKPSMCALFPLAKDASQGWHVRQWGYNNEEWDLFCLNPKASDMPAAKSLRAEIALAERFDREAAAPVVAAGQENGARRQ